MSRHARTTGFYKEERALNRIRDKIFVLLQGETFYMEVCFLVV